MVLKHWLLGLALVGSLAVLAAPVGADSGWLLLSPPEFPGHEEGATTFGVNAPLDRWRQVQAFDTARECEYVKDHEWSQALNQVETLLPDPPFPKIEATPRGQKPPAEQPSRQSPAPTPDAIERFVESFPDRPPADPSPTSETPSVKQGPREHQGLAERIRESLEEAERREAMMTEEQRQKRERAWQEWRKERDKIEVAREPKRRAINERYRPWKCVPVDAIYAPGVKKQP